MHLVPRVRLFLLRRPWIHWIVVAAALTIVAATVHSQLRALDDARRYWGDTQRVWIARHDTMIGEVPEASLDDVPVTLVPPAAVADATAPGPARRAIGAGEIIVHADLADGPGPGALAADGEIVLPIRDPLLTSVEVGVEVAVFADGLTLSDDATVVGVSDGVVLVAVDAADAAMVAAAVHTGAASLGFTS